MTCPFCKNNLQDGAEVCGHCRAYKNTRRRGSAHLLIISGYWLVLCGVCYPLTFVIARSEHSSMKGAPELWSTTISLLLLGGLLVLAGRKMPRLTRWIFVTR
jgi:hypothetical protein